MANSRPLTGRLNDWIPRAMTPEQAGQVIDVAETPARPREVERQRDEAVGRMNTLLAELGSGASPSAEGERT